MRNYILTEEQKELMDRDSLYCRLCQKDTVHQVNHHERGFNLECSECCNDPKFSKLMSKLNKIELAREHVMNRTQVTGWCTCFSSPPCNTHSQKNLEQRIEALEDVVFKQQRIDELEKQLAELKAAK